MTAWDETRVFVDTNILFYSVDSDAGAKHLKAREVLEEIWSAKTGIISTQILSEWTVNLRRKLDIDWRRIRGIIQPYLAWEVVAIEADDPLEASRIADKHRISYWDGLVLQAARKGGATILISEDLNPGQTIEGIEVVNPL